MHASLGCLAVFVQAVHGCEKKSTAVSSSGSVCSSGQCQLRCCVGRCSDLSSVRRSSSSRIRRTTLSTHYACQTLQIFSFLHLSTRKSTELLSNIIKVHRPNSGGVAAAVKPGAKESSAIVKKTRTNPKGDMVVIRGAAQNTATGATAGAPGVDVDVEIVRGTIETQQVDALVSPMVGHNPLSTRVGNTLFKIVGSQLTARFRKEAEEEMTPGDTVLVEGLPELPSNAVFFPSLVPWDDDDDGAAVQVLRLCINKILTSCENRGFGSVAFPVLGAGIALRFPDNVVARVLLEEVHEFQQNRAGRTPFMVRIVIHPNDEESFEVFKSVQETLQPDHESKRIIVLGKSGCGKSSLANTIFGEKLFTTNNSPNSGTRTCQAETKSVNGRSITLIETPGFLDAERSEDDMKPEIVRCITEWAPGPHAFLIVLKVEKFTEQEQAVITKICQYFSEEALKYAVIVFTHGDQLPKGLKIEEFVNQNKNLSDLVKRCGGRCHVIDNKYWKKTEEENYRSNKFQVAEMLNTIDKMTKVNKGSCYTNEMLQVVKGERQRVEQCIRLSSGNMSQQEIRNKAIINVLERLLIRSAGIATGALLSALLGVAEMVASTVGNFQNPSDVSALVTTERGRATVASAAQHGAVKGVLTGYNAAEGAETPGEAIHNAAEAVWNQCRSGQK
ncbi:uncharacterized protein LOC123979790 isoform X1 [Micropterus dolomieu]|uniref:uncharacterized protein LOC123979790 isoform X1 n=2 Tax=Micropterus dolomieu TaxID=147949 RepID=UPI001E8EC100|nr:uncharacterized protein LOC123979790 isoform X1 [Micropterus dolomieu]